MKKLLTLTSLALALTACNNNTADVAMDDHSMHSDSEHSMAMSEESSLDRLNNSPRHQEWVEVQNGDKTIHTFVVYPEVADNAPVVLLIHENKGLNDWARAMADQVAEAGYIAVAPDLLSQYSDTIERTSDFATPDAATEAIGKLDAAHVTSDLQAVADWSKTIPASNGKLATAGFCWGGSKSYEFATKSDDPDVTMVFYGTGPTDQAAYADIDSPVFGFYGGADQRVNATIETSDQYMTAAQKQYEYEIYDGAGHAFMRLGEDPAGEAANVTARNAAFERMKSILAELK